VEERATVRLSLGGGTRHRLATLIAAEVALEKHYHLEDTTTWRGGRVIPDLVLSKNARSWKDRKVIWIEIIAQHDPRKSWELKGYNVQDVLTVDVDDLTLDGIYEEAQRVIP
jgi:hypothetical protein